MLATRLVLILLTLSSSSSAQDRKWRTVVVNADSNFEAAGVADFDRDGNLDVMCGDRWYEVGTWKSHPVADIPELGGYRLDFANVPMDVDGDGWVDVVSCNWHRQSVVWRRNPGATGKAWEEQRVGRPGNCETALAVDLDGDGQLDFLPDVAQRTIFYRIVDGRLTGHQISDQPHGHGIGSGDINGDGRTDILKPDGWFEAPADPIEGKWTFHRAWNLGQAGIGILVHDFNGDGRADVFAGNGHDYGVYWLEQTANADPEQRWVRHSVDRTWSQAHALRLVDLDGDGNPEVLTGKRRYAHNGRDPGAEDAMVIVAYSFDRERGKFTKTSIHQGDGDGLGLAPVIADLDQNGDLDIVAPGRGGLYVYLQERTTPTPTRKPPHMVVILADDMGFGDPTCCNPDSKIATPHIDRLAREGMRFTDAHAPGSLCVPSRYGLLTGRYPARRASFHPAREAVIQAGRPTLPSILRNGGYRTAMVGKWHLGFDKPLGDGGGDGLTGGPLDRGFDSWFGIPASLDIPPYFYVRDREPIAPPTERIGANNTEGWTNIQGAFWRAGQIAPGFLHDDVLSRCRDEAVAQIRAHAKGGSKTPLFLYLALPAPHTPWLPAERFRGRSGAGMYGDFVQQVDQVVGDVWSALESAEMAKDTMLVFSSDNGPVWYPQDAQRFGHSSTGPYRGMKADSWEGGHRVPMIVRWPGEVEAGASSAQMVCFTDLLATCTAAAGIDPPRGAGEDSISFLPTLRGRDGSSMRTTLVLKANASVLREGPWKLIRHRGSGGFSSPRRGPKTDPAGQLYNLDQDPGESNNVWAEHPELVRRLERLAAAVVATRKPR